MKKGIKKKKSGSSLVTVTIIFALLFMAGASMITMVTSDYKLRITESKKLQNLYGAESGIDVAYNIILKNFDVAVKEGNKVVEETYNNLKKESGEVLANESIKNELNKKFKETFKRIILGQEYPEKVELSKCIEEFKYISNPKIPENSLSKDRYTSVDLNLGENKKEPKLQSNINLKEVDGKEVIDITLISDLKDKSLRKVQAKYNLEVPDYSGFYEENKQIVKNPLWENKVINIDGDMIASGEIDINGDVLVQGTNNYISKDNVVYDKYKGGIYVENKENIKDATSLNVNGNIATGKSLNIRNGSKAIIDGNIYGANLYLGEEKKSGNSDQYIPRSLEAMGAVVVNNDLAINSKKSTANIKEFYGINDITTDTLFDEQARKSSAILVNANEESNLTITDKAYIMGLGYIDTKGANGKYQTGESIAIKGNYIAYADPIIDGRKYDSEKMKFNYYQPLQLVEGFKNGDNNDFSKSEYFKAYSESNIKNLKNGGVVLPREVFAAGAIVGKDKDSNEEVSVKINSITPESNDEVLKKRASFANQLYRMGSLSEENESDIRNLVKLYNNPSQMMTVSSEVNFGKMSDYISPNNEKEKLILNNDKNKTIVIVGEGGNDSDYNDETQYIKINANGNKVIKTLIITAGNVMVTGDVELAGNIIAKGNLYIEDIKKNNKDIVLNYDEKVTNNIVAKHYEKLKEVIKIDQLAEDVNVAKIEIDTEEANNQDVSKYLEKGIWRIVK